MKKFMLSSLSILVLAAQLAIPYRVEAQATASSSGNPAQMAYFYKPPADNNLAAIAQNFKLVILTHKDESWRDQIEKLGFSNPIFQYYLANAIHNPGPDDCGATPYGNTAADQAGDYCWIRDNHADWFLRDSHGNIITDQDGSETMAYMDPANTGWQQFFVQRVLQRQEQYGWGALFLDNVDGSLYRFQRKGISLANYADDASYQNGVMSFLNAIHQGYAKVSGKKVFANLTEFNDNDDCTWFRYLGALDGAMNEGWGVDWHSGYLSESEWEEDISIMQKTQQLGKGAILVSQADNPNDLSRQAFAYASYLLVANNQTWFRYTNSSQYDQTWMYDNYKINLGKPKNSAYKVGKTWRRDFANGYVTVDPYKHKSAIVRQS